MTPAVEERSRAASSPVAVSDLLEGRTPRSGGLDLEHVRVLAEAETALPPILVHGPTMQVIDGSHRLHAARLRGQQTIECVFFHGGEREAFVLSVEANTKHGLPLSLSDRKAAAGQILHSFPAWSNRAIAAKVGLSPKTVGALRGGMGEGSTRIGRDGRVRPLNPVEGRLKARDILTRNPTASLRDIARGAGISISTAHDVRERVSNGESPLPGRAVAGARSGGGTTVTSHIRPVPKVLPVSGSDPRTVLESLKQDPALRYSSRGCTLIRWLESHLLLDGSGGALLPLIPSHQAAKVAVLARCTAESWNRIASAMESRAQG